MKIGYLGCGVWGYVLADLLASKGYEVTSWGVERDLINHLTLHREHPRLMGRKAPESLHFTHDLKEALQGKDMIVEGVTSAGIRPVFNQIKELGVPTCPLVLTSKGIEQNTGLLLTEVVLSVLGEEYRDQIGCLSGPSIAPEVFQRLPAAVVCSGYSEPVIKHIHHAFSCATLRVYPNKDINGIELGGAMKNIIAIACGAADGLGFGDNTKALLMTRGLHEIRRLAAVCGCKPETLNGLAGMGDLCVTCLSTQSRNYRFGRLIAEGKTPDEAKKLIGMVVEGAYTCLSAVQIAKKKAIELPIADAVYRVVYENLSPKEAVKLLLQRTTKHEDL
jgi:glycerol-3-phosphate dehydrogenase (NAD(P)+)